MLAVLVITSEYATGMIRTSLAADPRRRTLLGAKAAVVGAIVLVVGLGTSTPCFLLGQQLFRRGGFVYENGYPAVSLADGEAVRAVVGSGDTSVSARSSPSPSARSCATRPARSRSCSRSSSPRSSRSASFPRTSAEYLENSSLMAPGLALQQTVDRPDNIALAPWEALAVVAAYAVGALVLALWLIARRDA